MCINDGILGCVISIPVVGRNNFVIYLCKPIAIPVAWDCVKFMYVETEKPHLWIDQGRQYYFMSDLKGINNCKIQESRSYVCVCIFLCMHA
jgi:hypothetical protein